jgi:hypothetical protein
MAQMIPRIKESKISKAVQTEGPGKEENHPENAEKEIKGEKEIELVAEMNEFGSSLPLTSPLPVPRGIEEEKIESSSFLVSLKTLSPLKHVQSFQSS